MLEVKIEMSVTRLKDVIIPYLYVLPAVLLVSVFLLYPVIFTVYISFTEWDLITPPKWVGFAQYIKLFTDPAFTQSFRNTLIWTAGMLFLPVPIGLFLALIINGVPGEGLVKVLFYLPRILAATAVGIIWQFIYSSDGILNSILTLIGASKFTHTWLTQSPLNTIMMILTTGWGSVGWAMVMFLVGLQTIPLEVIEAAKIEGATEWQINRYIKIPLLKPMATIVITMSIIGSFTVFDLIWVMTRGGPYRSSETLAVTMYRGAFVLFQMGYGAAIAVVLSIIVLSFSIIYLRTSFREE